jgi:hypothetical protein
LEGLERNGRISFHRIVYAQVLHIGDDIGGSGTTCL